MTEINLGKADIEKAELISYDGTTRRDISVTYIYGFNIEQSMDSVAYSGFVDILDTSNVLEGMPIRGEETLNLEISTGDSDVITLISGIVHKVTDIHPKPSSNGVTYKLHFVSKATFKASTKNVITSFVNTPSEMAVEMFAENFSKIGPGTTTDPDLNGAPLPYEAKSYSLIKEGRTNDVRSEADRTFVVQPSKNNTRLIIPDLSPSEAMFFVASRSYCPSSPSQTFRFFETLDGYHFCTDEYLIKKANNADNRILDLFFAPIVDLDGTNVEAQYNRIEDLDILSKGVDTSTDLFSGAYTNEVLEIDFIHRRLNYSRFNYETDGAYIDMSGSPRDLGKSPHTALFRKDNFTDKNARQFMIFKDYTATGDRPSNILPNQHFPDIAHNRVSYYHHLNNTQVVAQMKGRLDIKPGMIINLDMKALDFVDTNINMNETLSGRYLVQSTSHTMSYGVLNVILKLAKFDWSGQEQVARNETADIGVTTA